MDTTQDTPRFGYISYAALSDVGRRRKNNEDSHGEWPEQGVFCVADGMGGARDGEVASRIVVEHLSMEVGKWNRFSPPIALNDRLALIDQTLNAASAWIFEYAETHDAKGCGTTFVGVALDPEDATKAVALHAGDSRLYRIHRKKIQLVTRDHSVANMAGVKNEAELDPAFRNMILRAVGISNTVELERTPFEVAEGDWIVICSDGLSKMMDDATIAKTIREAKSEEQAVKALVDGANRLGGKDNVTVVAVHAGALPGSGAVHDPLTEKELSEMRAPPPEDGEYSTESAFTIPTTVTDGGGENGQAKADGSFFSDDETETVETPPPKDGGDAETVEAPPEDGGDAETVETPPAGGGEMETVELAVGGEARKESAETGADGAPEVDAPAAAAGKPASSEAVPKPVKAQPPEVPEAAKAQPPEVPEAAKAPPAKAESAIREIGGRGKSAIAKWACIVFVAAVAILGAWIGLSKVAQSRGEAKARDAELNRFAATVEEAASKVERMQADFKREAVSEAEVSAMVASIREELSKAAGFVTGVSQAEIDKRRDVFNEAVKRLERAVADQREALAERERQIAQAKAEAAARAKAGEAKLADVVKDLRKKAQEDWLLGIPNASSNELARIEDNACGWIEDARKDAVTQAGDAGVGADAMGAAMVGFDDVYNSIKEAAAKRRGQLAKMADHERELEFMREKAEKTRKEAEAALNKAIVDLDERARKEWLAAAGGASSNGLSRIEQEARKQIEDEGRKALAAARAADVGADTIEDAKKRFQAILQNVANAANDERDSMALAAEKARKEAAAAEAKAREEKERRLENLRKICDKAQDNSPAKTLHNSRNLFKGRREPLPPGHVKRMLEIVRQHGDDFVSASEYPGQFEAEIDDFKWALEYLQKVEAGNKEVVALLEKHLRALEGK